MLAGWAACGAQELFKSCESHRSSSRDAHLPPLLPPLLQEVGEAITKLPSNFHPHRQIAKVGLGG